MAYPVNFPGSNFTFTAPEGCDDIGDLHTFRQHDGPANVSCWQLTPEEAEEVARTGQVWLAVMSWRQFYPAFVGSETAVRSVVIDTGKVWARSAPEPPT